MPLNANQLILDERRYNVDVLRESVERDLARLNADQRVAFDALCEAVISGAGGVFFLQGFGGTGKTFSINLVLAKIRADGGIALSTASSEIAATLLEGGTTAQYHIATRTYVFSIRWVPICMHSASHGHLNRHTQY